jgi:hypothetical protein
MIPRLLLFAMRRSVFITTLSLAALTLVSGCDLLGDSAETVAAAREAEGKAIGGACRHAGRAIEDCYTLNRKADKASIFSGWRDMNDYMRENKIEAVAPALPSGGKSAEKKADAGAVEQPTAAEAKAEAKASKAKSHES